METTVEHEGQTSLSELLERVSHGERITITENGVPVAVIEPPVAGDGGTSVQDAIRQMQRFELYNITLGEGTIRELIEEGRD